MRLLRFLAGLIIVVLSAYFLYFWPMRNPHPASHPARGILAIRDARVYVSPDLTALDRVTVVIRDGVIEAVASDVAIPAGARIIPCNHCVITAGFWNAHVHFTEPKWSWAAWKSAATLNPQLADMLTSRGFTTVADLGSDPRNTLSLRRRIESGELLGPKIYTSGPPQYPPDGIPYYLADLPFFVRWGMPQPDTPEDAARDE